MSLVNYYNDVAKKLGATFYQDSIGPNDRLLSRYYFNDQEHTVAILNGPTATFIVTTEEHKCVAHIGKLNKKVYFQ